MTEKELSELQREVEGETIVDPDVERAWIEEHLAQLVTQEGRLIAAFRLHKYCHNEDGLRAVKTDIKKVREALEYLRARKAETEKI